MANLRKWQMIKHQGWRKENSLFACQHYTHPFNNSFSRTTRVSRYQKGKTNLDLMEARGSEWQWHQ